MFASTEFTTSYLTATNEYGKKVMFSVLSVVTIEEYDFVPSYADRIQNLKPFTGTKVKLKDGVVIIAKQSFEAIKKAMLNEN